MPAFWKGRKGARVYASGGTPPVGATTPAAAAAQAFWSSYVQRCAAAPAEHRLRAAASAAGAVRGDPVQAKALADACWGHVNGNRTHALRDVLRFVVLVQRHSHAFTAAFAHGIDHGDGVSGFARLSCIYASALSPFAAAERVDAVHRNVGTLDAVLGARRAAEASAFCFGAVPPGCPACCTDAAGRGDEGAAATLQRSAGGGIGGTAGARGDGTAPINLQTTALRGAPITMCGTSLHVPPVPKLKLAKISLALPGGTGAEASVVTAGALEGMAPLAGQSGAAPTLSTRSSRRHLQMRQHAARLSLRTVPRKPP